MDTKVTGTAVLSLRKIRNSKSEIQIIKILNIVLVTRISAI